MTVTRDDIRAAAGRIAGPAANTPTVHAAAPSDLSGATVRVSV